MLIWPSRQNRTSPNDGSPLVGASIATGVTGVSVTVGAIIAVGDAAAVDEALWGIYRNHGVILKAGFLRLSGWIVGTGEVWLALYFLGEPVSIKYALLLESLGQAIRAAAFLLPCALGVQEGGYLLLGGVLGLSPEVSLALSLTKRVREILLGTPGLILWQISEGRHLWRRRRKASISEPS